MLGKREGAKCTEGQSSALADFKLESYSSCDGGTFLNVEGPTILDGITMLQMYEKSKNAFVRFK